MKTYKLYAVCGLWVAVLGGCTGSGTDTTETESSTSTTAGPTSSDSETTTDSGTTVTDTDTETETETETETDSDTTGDPTTGPPVCDTSEDFQSDPDHCGGCGEACLIGEQCIDGECFFDCEGYTNCNGTCYDIMEDVNNCGGCGITCPPDRICALGECIEECLPNELFCGETCIDVYADVNNCGGCDNTCTAPDGVEAYCKSSKCKFDCPIYSTSNPVTQECDPCDASLVLADGPVGYWRLSEESAMDTVVDASGGGHSGVYLDGVVVGQNGITQAGDTAIRLGDMDSSRVSIANFNAMPATEISVEFISKAVEDAESTPFSYATLDSSNEFLIRDAKSLKVTVTGDTWIDTGINIADNQWHHVVITWSSALGEVRGYIDGSLYHVEQSFQVDYSMVPGGTIILGQDQDELGGGFQTHQRYRGILDEVAVYDRILSDLEIQTHVNNTLCGK